MQDPVAQDEISLISFAVTLFHGRWRIIRWMVLGGVIAAVLVFARPILFKASASFVTQATDPTRSGLASLAGQFGISIGSAGQGPSPDFYARLLKSRVVLQPIVRDTFVVAELGNQRSTFLDLFKIDYEDPLRREEMGVKELAGMVDVGTNRLTGIVEVSVATKWRSVSLAIERALIKGVNDYNERSRQGQAAEERKFVEGRLIVAAADLRAAEDKFEQFQRGNRAFASAELSMERDRLQREMGMRQQLYTSLMQALDEARIRELRNTPVITIVEPPAASSVPEPRGRLRRGILGLIIGGGFGMVLVVVTDALERMAREGNQNAQWVLDALQRNPVARLWRRRAPGAKANVG